MFALELELLTGRYVAKEYDDHGSAEWPPHPARVFSALAAVHFEDTVEESGYSHERAALKWLAKQPAPSLYASGAVRRTVLDTFVPTNDKSIDLQVCHVANELIQAELKGDAEAVRKKRERLRRLSEAASRAVNTPNKEIRKRALSVLPTAGERKQARTFPSVFPYDPIVQFTWPEEPDQPIRDGLDTLAARVTRLGHSSSLVRLSWIASPRNPTWIPDPVGSHTLRWVSGRQLEDLMAAFEVHEGTLNRVLPFVARNYKHIDDPPPPSMSQSSNVFGYDWIVFELGGKARLPIVRAVDAASALRGAALAHAGSAPAEVLSGHEIDNAPSRQPHIAYVALPFVGFPHADGSILGVAAVLPIGLAGEERRAVLRAFGKITTLTLPPGIAFDLRRVAEPYPHLRSLDPLLWCGEAVVWATVTPILLDRFPGRLRSKIPSTALKAEQEGQDAIAKACERIGLPRPRVVSLTAPVFRGSVPAEEFRRRNRQGLPSRVRVHAVIDFGEPVRGPVLLGAGRYIGLGLCRPLTEERSR